MLNYIILYGIVFLMLGYIYSTWVLCFVNVCLYINKHIYIYIHLYLYTQITRAAARLIEKSCGFWNLGL